MNRRRFLRTTWAAAGAIAAPHVARAQRAGCPASMTLATASPGGAFAVYGQAWATLVSDLVKITCLVTGQPDWASVQISYTGDQIDQGSLLQYLVSYRNHNEFHEQCVERIFMDIWTRCKPIKLAVYARYTRRGGLDINPFRTSHPQALPRNIRTARQ